MKLLDCPACGGTIHAEPYRALDGSLWCRQCADEAISDVRQNYAQEEETAQVDLHALVLGVLEEREEQACLEATGWASPRLGL